MNSVVRRVACIWIGYWSSNLHFNFFHEIKNLSHIQLLLWSYEVMGLAFRQMIAVSWVPYSEIAFYFIQGFIKVDLDLAKLDSFYSYVFYGHRVVWSPGWQRHDVRLAREAQRYLEQCRLPAKQHCSPNTFPKVPRSMFWHQHITRYEGISLNYVGIGFSWYLKLFKDTT